MSKGLPTHLIGTHAFFPALLAYIRNVAAPASLPLDHVIFQSILLCLIARENHLILRTPEEDVGLVVRLTFWVSFPVVTYINHHCAGDPNLLNHSLAAGLTLDHGHLWVSNLQVPSPRV